MGSEDLLSRQTRGELGHAAAAEMLGIERAEEHVERDQYAWQGLVARQRLRQVAEVRRGLSQSLCRRRRSARLDRPISRLQRR